MVIKKKASHYKLLQEELRRTTKALAKQTKAASQPKVVRATAQLKVHHLQQALKATKEASKEALKSAQQDLKSAQQSAQQQPASRSSFSHPASRSSCRRPATHRPGASHKHPESEGF